MGSSLDQEIIDLKKAYKVFNTALFAFEYGPLRGYLEPDTKIIQTLQRETIEPAVLALVRETKKIKPGVYTVDAPSPWHAYFFLRFRQQHLYRHGMAFGESQIDERTGDHMFFRGQRCSSWSFKSCLRRTNRNNGTEQRAATVLAEYFKRTFLDNEQLALNTAKCFSQHYGIATDLVDVTCIPDIAIWFACQTGDRCPQGEDTAVVRAVTWAGQEPGSKTTILLPPAFVRNAYSQRGLFLDTNLSDGVLTGDLTLDVRFPRDTIGEEFRILREGQRLEVYKKDNYEEDLVGWARKIANECSDDETARKRVLETSINDLPDFWKERELGKTEEQVDAMLSILDWILPATCVTVNPLSSNAVEGGSFLINGRKVIAIVKANQFFFKLLCSAPNSYFQGHRILQTVRYYACKELGLTRSDWEKLREQIWIQ